MEQKLAQLHQALCHISTKGEDTKYMADCLIFLESMIREEQEKRQLMIDKINKGSDSDETKLDSKNKKS